MNALEDALVEVARRIDELDVPYAVVGGMANAIWGEPRSTLDVDVTVWVEEPAIAGFVASLGTTFRFCTADPLAFAHETRVLPVESGAGVRIDFILGLLPFEKEAIDRAVTVDVAGCAVRFVTAEDLILIKVGLRAPAGNRGRAERRPPPDGAARPRLPGAPHRGAGPPTGAAADHAALANLEINPPATPVDGPLPRLTGRGSGRAGAAR